MKKLCLILTMLVVFNASIAFAEQNPLAQLTGKVWVESPKNVKESFLYGVECAVAMEYLTAKISAEEAGKEISHEEIVRSLTAFPENWILAFQGVERTAIAEKLDSWYMENPTEMERPVFNVLWYEIMEPKLEKR